MTCPREGRLIGGCNFKPRYDDMPLTETELRHGADIAWLHHLGAIRKITERKHYVRDVCTRCGKTVERNG